MKIPLFFFRDHGTSYFMALGLSLPGQVLYIVINGSDPADKYFLCLGDSQ